MVGTARRAVRSAHPTVRRAGGRALPRGFKSRDMFAFSKMALARIDKALDALGVLACVAVLHPGGRLLAVAGDSPSRPECADFGKSRNRDRWLYRGLEVGDARSTSP